MKENSLPNEWVILNDGSPEFENFEKYIYSVLHNAHIKYKKNTYYGWNYENKIITELSSAQMCYVPSDRILTPHVFTCLLNNELPDLWYVYVSDDIYVAKAYLSIPDLHTDTYELILHRYIGGGTGFLCHSEKESFFKDKGCAKITRQSFLKIVQAKSFTYPKPNNLPDEWYVKYEDDRFELVANFLKVYTGFPNENYVKGYYYGTRKATMKINAPVLYAGETAPFSTILTIDEFMEKAGIKRPEEQPKKLAEPHVHDGEMDINKRIEEVNAKQDELIYGNSPYNTLAKPSKIKIGEDELREFRKRKIDLEDIDEIGKPDSWGIYGKRTLKSGIRFGLNRLEYFEPETPTNNMPKYKFGDVVYYAELSGFVKGTIDRVTYTESSSGKHISYNTNSKKYGISLEKKESELFETMEGCIEYYKKNFSE